MPEMSHSHALPEEGVLFAQLESFLAETDYGADQRCVRLTGVSPADFEAAAFNDEGGCDTYVIDIVFDEFCAAFVREAPNIAQWKRLLDLAPYWTHGLLGRPNSVERAARDALGIWLRLEFTRIQADEGSYAYCAFEDQEPTFIRLDALVAVADGPPVAPPAESVTWQETLQFDQRPTLTAFQVGQGMCSLLSIGDRQILLDCGAGKPITRRRYRTTGMVSQLKTQLAGRLSAIISHADRDHYCLLEWDAGLLGAVDSIYTASNAPFLILSSKVTKGRVKGITHASIKVDTSNVLQAFRSDPARPSESNHDCLVVVVDIAGKRALLPGDYLYCQMQHDNNAAIQALVQPGAYAAYHAVVAPHHGELDCRLNVPDAAVTGESIAFFSAGTYLSYRHPRDEALEAHSAQGYRCVNDRTSQHIVGTQLLP